MDDTELFIALYTAGKCIYYNNDWVAEPKRGSNDYEFLDKARKIVDELGGNYAEFLQCQFKAFKYYRRFPLPAMLSTGKAIKRYKAYLSRRRKETTPLYSIDGDGFVVSRTQLLYPLSQARSSLREDPVATYASYLYQNVPALPTTDRKEAVNALEYYLAKLASKGKQPPNGLIESIRKYRSEDEKDKA